MRPIARFEKVEIRDDEAGFLRVTADPAGSLDVFRGTFRLADYHHEAQPTDVQADLNHVGGVTEIDRLPLGQSNKKLLEDLGNLAAPHPAGELLVSIDEPSAVHGTFSAHCIGQANPIP